MMCVKLEKNKDPKKEKNEAARGLSCNKVARGVDVDNVKWIRYGPLAGTLKQCARVPGVIVLYSLLSTLLLYN